MPNQSFYFEKIKTNIGIIYILECQKGICFIAPANDPRVKKIQLELSPQEGLIYYTKIKKNLIQFLKKKEKLIKFPIYFILGSVFQISVWKQLLKIPYGSISTYSLVAEKIQNLKAVRAVGTAIGKNPIMIYVPCHRVIAKSGSLGGYAYGMLMKHKILDIEKSV
ncbi:MAG: methylated-DNA--[protein]-cysteine S-methyltransferase [Proteobacteria bacterium]|nr:methylated-DNA--[protein]-cysteine S-methyltransferase [Pseudomonadota bacterium]